MAEEITKWRYQKRTAKASLTRLENYTSDVDIEIACEIEQLKVRIAKLDEIYKSFNEVQSELVAKDDTISKKDLKTEAEEIENRYITLKVLAERMIKDKLRKEANNEEVERTMLETYELANNKGHAYQYITII